MGAAASQEDSAPVGAPRPPPLGPRPTNTRLPTPFEPSLLRDARRDVRPVEYRPPVQQSDVVRNVVALNRSSLTLVRGRDPSVYLVQFEFTAEVEGFVTIYYAAKEVVQRDGSGEAATVKKVSYVGRGDLPGKTRFSVGAKQRYRQNEDKGLDVRQFTTSELRYKDGGTYPVVIRLEACYGQSEKDIPARQRVKSQTTFAELVSMDGVYEIQIVAQQVLVDGTIYRMQDMYGIGATDVTARKEDDGYQMDDSHECVICLTEPSNTAVQPCYHLCLCDECARILGSETEFHRRKCPVCRTQLVSFLRIITGNTASDESSADASTVANAPSSGAVDGVGGNVPEAGATVRLYRTIPMTETSPGEDGDDAPAATERELVASPVTAADEAAALVEGSTVPSGPNAV